MKIEEGKYYLRADGRKAGPAKWDNNGTYPFNVPWGRKFYHAYTADGVSCIGDEDARLIAEWTPARDPELTSPYGDNNHPLPECEVATGTLQELSVKPGDVVALAESNRRVERGKVYTCYSEKSYGSAVFLKGPIWVESAEGGWLPMVSDWKFRVISRASDTPKTWGEMTDAEKGALLLAHHEGKVVEVHDADTDEWRGVRAEWIYYKAYRIRP